MKMKQIYTYKNGCLCVCVCVCMSGNNSGTPGAISTKLGTHIAICMCKNLMYVSYTGGVTTFGGKCGWWVGMSRAVHNRAAACVVAGGGIFENQL
jgi:hypothetical protein